MIEAPTSNPWPGVRIAVVVPAYRVAGTIERVLGGIPRFVDAIVVVDDASPDDLAERIRSLGDPRVVLLRHEQNRGVGGAMVTGFAEVLRRGLDIAVKMDGDDQMDPAFLPSLIEPLVRGEADVAKGNRYHDLESVRAIPAIRMLGNIGLTFLAKLASGYWNEFDPANGYVAIRTSVLRKLELGKLPRRYFFESGLLIELGIVRAVIRSVPMPARYAGEGSSLSVLSCLVTFPPRLLAGLSRRIFWRYFVHDFSVVSLFVLLGLPLCLGGAMWGVSIWSELQARGQFASAGQVMLAAMPIILGFQLLLQAVVLDIGNVPREPISPPLPSHRAAALEGRTSRVEVGPPS